MKATVLLLIGLATAASGCAGKGARRTGLSPLLDRTR